MAASCRRCPAAFARACAAPSPHEAPRQPGTSALQAARRSPASLAPATAQRHRWCRGIAAREGGDRLPKMAHTAPACAACPARSVMHSPQRGCALMISQPRIPRPAWCPPGRLPRARAGAAAFRPALKRGAAAVSRPCASCWPGAAEQSSVRRSSSPARRRPRRGTRATALAGGVLVMLGGCPRRPRPASILGQ